LLAIADNLGHGAEARAALIKGYAVRPIHDVGVQALVDIRLVWLEVWKQKVDRFTTKELAKAVVELAPERWADWRGPSDRGQPHELTRGELSRLLRRFGIYSKTIRPMLSESKSGTGTGTAGMGRLLRGLLRERPHKHTTRQNHQPGTTQISHIQQHKLLPSGV
jgi:hypothetical protein